MRMTYVLPLAALILSAPAYASGNRNNSGGNSTAVAGAAAGAVAFGGSGSGYAITDVRNTNTNFVGGGNISGGNVSGVGGAGGNVTYNAPGSQRITHQGSQTIRNTPDVNAPAIWSNNPCTVALSGGVAVAGFGASIGTAIEDRDCTRRANAQHLAAMGERDAAREVMCNNAEVRAAFARTGRPCAGEPVAVQSVAVQPRAAVPEPVAPQRNRPAYCRPGVMNSECVQ